MERLQRIKELVEQKLKIDQELADLKAVVKAERAAFAVNTTKAAQEKAGQLTLGSRIKQSPGVRGFLATVYTE